MLTRYETTILAKCISANRAWGDAVKYEITCVVGAFTETETGPSYSTAMCEGNPGHSDSLNSVVEYLDPWLLSAGAK